MPERHTNIFNVFACVLCVVCLFFSNGEAAEEYLSAGELAAITAGSVTLGIVGYEVFKIDVDDKSRFRGPLPGELSLQKFLGGAYTSGRTNFLDSEFGSAVTPIAMGTILTSSNLTWPIRDAQKDAAQDLTLYLSGLIATKGITDLTKGLIRRPRPYAWLADSSLASSERGHTYLRTSFFSGHASSAFFSAAFTNLRLRSIMRHRLSADEYREWRWAPPTVLLGWASFVAWSRIHAYKHYPSDVIVGAAVGYVMAELFYSLARHEETVSQGNSTTPMIRVSFKF